MEWRICDFTCSSDLQWGVDGVCRHRRSMDRCRTVVPVGGKRSRVKKSRKICFDWFRRLRLTFLPNLTPEAREGPRVTSKTICRYDAQEAAVGGAGAFAPPFISESSRCDKKIDTSLPELSSDTGITSRYVEYSTTTSYECLFFLRSTSR